MTQLLVAAMLVLPVLLTAQSGGHAESPVSIRPILRDDSLLVAGALVRAFLADSAPFRSGIVLDTTSTGWNGLVGGILRTQAPSILRARSAADSTVTPWITFWGSPSSDRIIISASRCTPGRLLMYGVTLHFVPTREGDQWGVRKAPEFTRFHGICGPST